MMAESNVPRILWLNTVFLIATPVLALILTPIYVWNHGVTWFELVIMFALWFMVGQGITAGYHRLFSHRGYRAAWPLRLYFAIVGAAAFQNSIIVWASDHRRHHKNVDTGADPYNSKRGFWYSHIGWIMYEAHPRDEYENVPDLWSDWVCRFQHRFYWPIGILFNVSVPMLLGLATGRVGGMLIFGLLVRMVLVHHCTFFINSLAHMWGRQPWSTENTARDNWFLSLFSFGEGYHNYHHAYQYDYRNGPYWYNYDPSKWLIWLLSHTPLARDLKRVPDEVLLRSRYNDAKNRFFARLDRRSDTSKEEWHAYFREGSERLAERSRSIQEALKTGTATLVQQTELFRLHMRERLVVAEGRLERALTELGRRRRAWMQMLRTRRRDMTDDDLREMKHAFRAARRQARHALRDIKSLMAHPDPLALRSAVPAS